MTKKRKMVTDSDRFMEALRGRSGSPHFQIKTKHAGTPYEESREVEKWWCPSCREPKALRLEYPEWLPYPKPRCKNCSDIEVYQELGLQELAYRGESPPLVMCDVAKSYRKKTGKWPDIGREPGQWPGSCRRCGGCREFTTERQAYQRSTKWTGALSDAAEAIGTSWVWVITIPEADKRRVFDALTYRLDREGGAFAQIPVEEGRVVFAAIAHPSSGRVSPLLQRLVRDGEHIEGRSENRTVTHVVECPKTHTHELDSSCFDCSFNTTDCDPDDGHITHESVNEYTFRITLEEQLEALIHETLMGRIWRVDGRIAKATIRDRPTEVQGDELHEASVD